MAKYKMRVSKSEVIRVLVAVLLGLFVLFTSSSIAIVGSQFAPDVFGFLTEIPFLTHSGMISVSIILIWYLTKRELSVYGFKKPEGLNLARFVLLSLSLGVVVSLIRSFVGGGEEGSIEDFFGIQIIVGIWIYASIAEEILTRGLVQGYLKPLAERGVIHSETRISVPVLVGALFFALMHIAMVTLGVDTVSVIATIVSAFVLGIIAGYYYEKTGSLAPAILVHMLFNVAGSIMFFLSGLL